MSGHQFAAPLAHRSSARGFILASYWMLLGVPVGLVLLAWWQTFVDTSPTLSDEDRIRGWGTVVRELPATAFLIAFPVAGFLLAVRASRSGARAGALRAFWLHGAALFFALLVVLGGSAENIMETRPATVKWILLPVEVGVPALAVWWSRRIALAHEEG